MCVLEGVDSTSRKRCANTGSSSQSELLRLLRHLSSSRNILITSSACCFSSPVISARGSSELTFFFNSHQLRWVSAKPCFKNHSLRASSRRFEMGCTFTTVSVARRALTSRIVASIAFALAGSRFRIRWRCLTRHIASHRVRCRLSSEEPRPCDDSQATSVLRWPCNGWRGALAAMAAIICILTNYKGAYKRLRFVNLPQFAT